MKMTQRKAVGGYHTTTTAIENVHTNIASGCKKRYATPKCCVTFRASLNCRAGAENTVIDSGVYTATFKRGFFSSKFYGFGREGVAYPQGRQHGGIHVFSTFTSILCARKAPGMVFQSHSGAETMTNVIRTTTPKAAPLGNTPALSTSNIARQQAIENALSTALYFIRLPSTESGLRAATSRAIRAASMLKQACSDAKIGGAA